MNEYVYVKKTQTIKPYTTSKSECIDKCKMFKSAILLAHQL